MTESYTLSCSNGKISGDTIALIRLHPDNEVGENESAATRKLSMKHDYSLDPNERLDETEAALFSAVQAAKAEYDAACPTDKQTLAEAYCVALKAFSTYIRGNIGMILA